MDAVTRLVNTVRDTRERVTQSSRQRRGGVTDLFGVDYVDTIRNTEEMVGDKKSTANYHLTVSGDLDRFQRWFLKVIVTNNKGDNSEQEQEGVRPMSDVHLEVFAHNATTGHSETIDLTPFLKAIWKCNWIADAKGGEGIFPNGNPMEGYDLMKVAWYLNDKQREALYSPGEKIFSVKALGDATVTLRLYLKFSHIN